MEKQKTYYRRHLPHYQPHNAMFFMTFRLAGSLPAKVIAKLKEEREQEEKQIIATAGGSERKTILYQHQKIYFGKFDSLLDRNSYGPQWLADNRAAGIVSGAIHYRDGKGYELYAYCIMPNHVHLVIDLNVGRRVFPPYNEVVQRDDSREGNAVGRRVSSSYEVTQILENLKWYTALKTNALLRRQGQFWQRESYDHVIRDGKELERIIRYVINNPVKAGLVDSWAKWKWTYWKKETV